VARIFISSDWRADGRVADITRRLKGEADIEVDQSPLTPSLGEDPRWKDWYGRGSLDAIANADYFVAVVTKGYDGSTWMAHEFDVAWKQCRQRSRPRLFVAKATNKPLPLGFKTYEDASTIIVGEPEAVVATLLAHVRAAAAKSGA